LLLPLSLHRIFETGSSMPADRYCA
jgi:hypothetical protein